MINTEVVRVSPLSPEDSIISHAADIIKQGGLVVFPTETVYGLGADATNPCAAEKIYKAKGRPSDNPLIIHIASPEDAEKYAYTSEAYYRLAKRFMPGPFTVVLRAKETVPCTTRGGLDTVAVRCPSNPVARRLIELSGVPIAAPSANISGSPSPTSAGHAIDDMYGRCEIVIDGGECDFGLESTIVKLENDDSITVLRPGKITPEDIKSEGLEVRVANAVVEELSPGEVALSPGMKYKHYSPRATVVLLDADREKCAEYIRTCGYNGIAILAYTEDVRFYTEAVKCAVVYDFGEKENKTVQAHKLFNILREADKQNFDIIYAPLPPKAGIGLALYNRMIRAAAHKVIRL